MQKQLVNSKLAQFHRPALRGRELGGEDGFVGLEGGLEVRVGHGTAFLENGGTVEKAQAIANHLAVLRRAEPVPPRFFIVARGNKR